MYMSERPAEGERVDRMSSQPWWKTGVIYQIPVASFADSDGDGIGDLRGILGKLDYLSDGTDASLGVDVIWLTPINPSPMCDFGYDVSDSRNHGCSSDVWLSTKSVMSLRPRP